MEEQIEAGDSLSVLQRTILACSWALMTLLSLSVPAANDDWPLLAPILEPAWSNLVPTSNFFWRPLEVLFREALGLAPQWYPAANHLAVAIPHGLSVVAILRILSVFGVGREVRFGAGLVFLIAPAGAATVFSVDGTNQSWALAFGLWGASALVNGRGPLRWGAWLACSMLAGLSRESGLTFFGIGPVVLAGLSAHRVGSAWRRPAIVTLAIGAVLGAIGALAYLGMRTSFFSHSGFFGGGGRYELQSAPTIVFRNLGLLIGAAASTIDTLLVFLKPTHWLLAALTTVAGVPLLMSIASGWRTWLSRPSTWLLLLAVVLASLPHALSPRPAEMYVYPTLGMMCLLGGVIAASPSSGSRRRFAVVSLTMFALVSLAVDLHKCAAMVSYGRSADALTASIDAQTTGTRPSVVCVVCRAEYWEGSENGYSIYYQPGEWAAFWGMSILPRWNWQHPKRFVYCQPGQTCDRTCDATWVFPEDGRVIVYAGPPR